MKNKIHNIFLLIYCISFILFSCKSSNYKEQSVLLFVNDINYEFVKVKGGVFDMGCKPPSILSMMIGTKETECNCYTDNIKEHIEVNSFYVSKYLVTYKQFAQFIEETNYITSLDSLKKLYVTIDQDTLNKPIFPSNISYELGEKSRYGKMYNAYIKAINWEYTPYLIKYSENDLKYPVSLISIYDAKAFSEWLSQKLNKNIRLLTDEEWEFTARGGLYSKGYCMAGTNDSFEDLLDVDTTYAYHIYPNYKVDARIPNELGIYGMHDGEIIGSYYQTNSIDFPMVTLRKSIVWSKMVRKNEYGEIDFNMHFRVAMDIPHSVRSYEE